MLSQSAVSSCYLEQLSSGNPMLTLKNLIWVKCWGVHGVSKHLCFVTVLTSSESSRCWTPQTAFKQKRWLFPLKISILLTDYGESVNTILLLYRVYLRWHLGPSCLGGGVEMNVLLNFRCFSSSHSTCYISYRKNKLKPISLHLHASPHTLCWCILPSSIYTT